MADLERHRPDDRRDRPNVRLTTTGAVAFAAGGGAIWSTGYLGHGRPRRGALGRATGAMRTIEIGIYGDLIAADDTAAYYVGEHRQPRRAGLDAHG